MTRLIQLIISLICLNLVLGEIIYRPLTKIANGEGLPAGTISTSDAFGYSVSIIGDVNNDNIPDLAVGAIGDSTAGYRRGAVHILMLNSEFQVINNTKITDGQGGLPNGTLGNSEHFGSCLSLAGDLNSDGIPDLIVGASDNSLTGASRGAIYILFLSDFGWVDSFVRISDGQGGFPSGILEDVSQFGLSCTGLGHLGGSQTRDIAVGSNGQNYQGEIFILFLNNSGLVESYTQIAGGVSGFPSGLISDNDRLGYSLSTVSDLNSDFLPELIIGARGKKEAYLTYLSSNGAVESVVSLTDQIDPSLLASADFLGTSNSWLPGLDRKSGETHLVLGSSDSTGGLNRGGLYFMSISSDGDVVEVLKVVDGEGGLPAGTLENNDFFGGSITSFQSTIPVGVSTLEESGETVVFIGATGDSSMGAVYVARITGPGSDSGQDNTALIATMASILPCLLITFCVCLAVVLIVGIAVLMKKRRGTHRLDLENPGTKSEDGFQTGISLQSTSSSIKLDWGKENWQIDNADLKLEEQPIANGASGVVYRAEYHGTTVAAKTLIGDDQLSSDEFFHEIELLRRLHHPNVVLYMGATNKPRRIITEFVTRGSLLDVLKKSSQEMTDKRVHKIAVGIAKGMAYLHSNNPPVIHRDLKSQNILIAKNYLPKIADFGISRTVTNQSMTRRAGTTRWTAPEVLSGNDYTEKADVYSYGVILWELLDGKGQMPFSEEKWERQVENKVIDGERPRLSKEDDHPEALIKIMNDCWQDKPESRPSFKEIVKRLKS